MDSSIASAASLEGREDQGEEREKEGGKMWVPSLRPHRGQATAEPAIGVGLSEMGFGWDFWYISLEEVGTSDFHPHFVWLGMAEELRKKVEAVKARVALAAKEEMMAMVSRPVCSASHFHLISSFARFLL